MKILGSALLVLAQMTTSCNARAASPNDRINASRSGDWAIMVTAYQISPNEDSTVLEELGSLVVRETANGFLSKTIITKDGFHEGATFCILVNKNLGNSEDERNRILTEITELQETAQIDDFNVTHPADCFAE
ncbi:MAG: hypothetical protein AB7T49_16260 [Oligoflexales bacterium]